MLYLHFELFDGYDRMFSNPVNLWIYLFHMPLFVFVSGIFHRNAVSIRRFLEKIFRRLILPMLIWAIICTIYSYWFENKPLSVLNYISIVKYAWWFIWVIVFCKILLSILCKIKKKWIIVISVILLYIYVSIYTANYTKI